MVTNSRRRCTQLCMHLWASAKKKKKENSHIQVQAESGAATLTSNGGWIAAGRGGSQRHPSANHPCCTECGSSGWARCTRCSQRRHYNEEKRGSLFSGRRSCHQRYDVSWALICQRTSYVFNAGCIGHTRVPPRRRRLLQHKHFAAKRLFRISIQHGNSVTANCSSDTAPLRALHCRTEKRRKKKRRGKARNVSDSHSSGIVPNSGASKTLRGCRKSSCGRTDEKKRWR